MGIFYQIFLSLKVLDTEQFPFNRRRVRIGAKRKAIHENTNPKRKKHFPINKKGKRNKRIGEKQQLEPFKIEQQIKFLK